MTARKHWAAKPITISVFDAPPKTANTSPQQSTQTRPIVKIAMAYIASVSSSTAAQTMSGIPCRRISSAQAG